MGVSVGRLPQEVLLEQFYRSECSETVHVGRVHVFEELLAVFNCSVLTSLECNKVPSWIEPRVRYNIHQLFPHLVCLCLKIRNRFKRETSKPLEIILGSSPVEGGICKSKTKHNRRMAPSPYLFASTRRLQKVACPQKTDLCSSHGDDDLWTLGTKRDRRTVLRTKLFVSASRLQDVSPQSRKIFPGTECRWWWFL
jgi:hypothetical protein